MAGYFFHLSNGHTTLDDSAVSTPTWIPKRGVWREPRNANEVTKTLAALKARPATARAKAKFVLATDGDTFEAEDLVSAETVACAYADFLNHYGFFLPLAGITTVKQVRDSSFDIRATSRLNRLYVELLKDNPEWGRPIAALT